MGAGRVVVMRTVLPVITTLLLLLLFTMRMIRTDDEAVVAREKESVKEALFSPLESSQYV